MTHLLLILIPRVAMLKPGQRNIAVLRPDVHHCVVAIDIDTQASDTVWMEARLDS